LWQHSSYGWSFVDYLHTPKNTQELDKWNCFVDKFKSIPKTKIIQELILKIIHGGTKVWCVQLCTLIIDIAKRTKYKRRLPMLVCLLALVKINKIATTHCKVIFQEMHEYIKPNINALVEKWMPCDMFWTPRFPRSE
jgi:hypothetical protein